MFASALTFSCHLPFRSIAPARPRVQARAFALLAMLAGAALAGASSARAAGGAYLVDDYEVLEPGQCQIETWATFARNRERSFVAAPSCTPAALPWLQVGVGFERSGMTGDWASASELTLKASIVPIERFGVGVGLAANLVYDHTERRKGGGSAIAIFTLEPIQRTRLHLNVGYERDHIAQRDFGLWGVGASIEPIDNLAFIAEASGRSDGQRVVQAGVRPTFFDGRVDVDFIVGRRFKVDPTTWFTVGAAIRF